MEQNIIASSCVGAYIMRDYLHQKFTNPFIWTSIDGKSMLNLINNYDTIDWFNIKMTMTNGLKNGSKPIITIDDKVTIKYPHHILSLTDKTPRKSSVNDINYQLIWRYVSDAYFRRIERMCSVKIDPIFVWVGGWKQQNPTDSEFRAINTKYRVITYNDACRFNGVNSKVAEYVFTNFLKEK